MKLNNINKIVFEIINILSNDEKLASLVYKDATNAGEDVTSLPSAETLIQEEYFVPYMAVPIALSQMTRNTFVQVVLEEINYEIEENGEVDIRGNISIFTKPNLIRLNNNKLRLQEISARIYELLNNVKLSCTGEVYIYLMQRLVLSEFIQGCRITFNVREQMKKDIDL